MLAPHWRCSPCPSLHTRALGRYRPICSPRPPSCPREPETGRGAKALRAPSFCLNRASSSQHPTHNDVGERRPFLSASVTDTGSPCVTSVSALLCTGFPSTLRLSTSPFHRCCACPFLRHWSLSLSCKTSRIAASTSLFVWSALELAASRCGRAAGGHCCHVFSQLSSKAAFSPSALSTGHCLSAPNAQVCASQCRFVREYRPCDAGFSYYF